jgi:ParB/RepB/Spo0J family partition protein
MPLTLSEVPLDRIVFEETSRPPDTRLIESLHRFGLFQAVELHALPDGRYSVEDGSRRCAAACQLEWRTIRALVIPAAEAECPRDLKAILVNTRRKSLKQLDLARHARRLLRETEHSQAELARQIQISKSSLWEMLKVLDCADLVAAIEEGLEFGAASALSVLTANERLPLLHELRETRQREGKFPSVRRVRERVRLRQGHAPLPEISTDALPAAIDALQLQELPTAIEVVRAKCSQIKITLMIAEEDHERIDACLAEVHESLALAVHRAA